MKISKVAVAIGIAIFAGISMSASAVISSQAFDLRDCMVSKATAAAAAANDCIGTLSTDTIGTVNPSASNINSPLSLPVGSFGGASTPVLSKVDADPWNPGAFAYNDWVESSRYEKGQGGTSNLGLTVTGAGAVRNWSVTTPLNGMWIVLVKQSSQAVLYLFDSLAGATGGTIDLSGFWQANDYSHVALLTRRGEPGEEVPIPATPALLGLGLLMLLVRKRRAVRATR